MSTDVGLSASELTLLQECIQYTNLAELRELCKANGVPYRICVHRPDGRVVTTADTDRKGVVIDLLLHFIQTGTKKPPTTFPAAVVAERLDRDPTETDRVLYGSYRNGDPATLALMRRLTADRFKFGAIAQEVLREQWSTGTAPTFREFAALWLAAAEAHTRPNPEWAYLTDLAQGTADRDWKALRIGKAQQAMELVAKATSRPAK